MTLQPELACRPTTTGAKIAGPALAAGGALLLIGAGIALGMQHTPAPTIDPCGLPAGVQVDNLEPRDATLITRRLLACSDQRFGRITGDDYRAQIAAIDKQWLQKPVVQPQVVWASAVRGFSTQYTNSSWAATQALGAPNVFPAHGDNSSAWASLGADDRDEWLEVGFDRAGSISGVEIYETYNPGAIDRIELITQSGRIIEAQPNAITPGGASAKRTANVACTTEPVVAVRVHVASTKVVGWNEIDAIGVVPCTR